MKDKENKITFLIIPGAIFQDKDLRKLKGYVLRPLWALINYYDVKIGGKPGCWASNKTLYTFLGITEQTLRTGLRKLEELGKIVKEGSGNNRVYYSNFDKDNQVKIILGSDKDNHNFNKDNHNFDKDNHNFDKDNLGVYNNKKEEKILDHIIKDTLLSDKTSDVKSSSQSSVKRFSGGSKPYIYSEYLLELILERWPNYDNARLQEKDYKEKKLQSWAYSIDLMIRIDKRPISEIIEVIEWAQNDEFWWKNILSADKLRKQYDKLLIGMGKVGTRVRTSNNTQQEELLNDPRPDITKKVVKEYRRFVGKAYKLTNKDHNKFIETTKILLEKLGLNPTEFCVDSLLADLVMVLREHYTNKGGVVHPGSFCSEATWVKYMPQYFGNIPQVKMYDYHEQATKEFDDIVSEEEQLTKDIERNMQKQNIQSDKPIGDNDDPELDYMLNI